MAQIMHCFMLLFIVFVVAEIRNVLINSDPRTAEPITIWDETPQPVAHSSGKITFMP